MILLKLLRGIFAANRLHDYTKKDLAGVSFDIRKFREDFIPFLPPGCVSWNFVTSKTSLLTIIQISSDLLCDATSL